MPIHLITTTFVKFPFHYHDGAEIVPRQNPRPRRSIFPPIPGFIKCKGIQVCPAKRESTSNGVVGVGDWKSKEKEKEIDVATLGNLCVDIVLNVPELPPKNPAHRKPYMDRLSASPPDKQYWEAGGNCNMAIAAARLGLHCITIGHVGNEIYGRFLLDVLQEEGIGTVGMTDAVEASVSVASYETLLCWVLVDPLQRHGFCSRADFSKEPAFSWLRTLSKEVKMAIKKSKILFCNGYGFDELSPHMIVSALEYAVEVGTSVFFDPGPRGKSLSNGTPEEQRALSQLLRMSDVLLLTSDEIRSTWSSISRWIGSDQTTIIGHLSHRRSKPSAESKQDLSHRRSVRTDPVRGFCCAPFFRPDLSTPPLQTHAVKDATPLMVKTHGSKDPAEALTGIKNPILAGQELLKKGVRTKWVIVKMGSRGSILITMSSISCAPAFKVNVVDTVGCGDSFVAAIAFGFIHNMPMVSSLAIANAVGAATAMGCGAGRNVATLQRVIELMKAADLNEDEEFLNELLVENVDTQEITCLSKVVINGNNHQLNRIALQKVVSELLPKLESSHVEGKVPS
uniref:Carbohydrate kinase PfkB domain-containing protein n=1 Tax=Fagus sylvatica TaxID=28930 RepID=A0A2N9I417_FAGSY